MGWRYLPAFRPLWAVRFNFKLIPQNMCDTDIYTRPCSHFLILILTSVPTVMLELYAIVIWWVARESNPVCHKAPDLQSSAVTNATRYPWLMPAFFMLAPASRLSAMLDMILLDWNISDFWNNQLLNLFCKFRLRNVPTYEKSRCNN